jgi:hypothetical protein
VGAVEHLKTLCCLGLPPESAMIAVTPVLHEVIPHGCSRMALLEPDSTINRGYSENPSTSAIFRDRLWRFTDDPSSPWPLWMPCFHSVGIRWTLHLQRRSWLESAWYREIEELVLGFGRQDLRYRFADPPAQGPSLHGRRRATSGPAASMARSCISAGTVGR